VVTRGRTAQDVEGDLNVAGKVCVGSGANQRCFAPTSGGAAAVGLVDAGNLTLLGNAIDISTPIQTVNTKTTLNARTIIRDATRTDPGAIRAVLVSAVAEPFWGGAERSYYNCEPSVFLAGYYWAGPAPATGVINEDDPQYWFALAGWSRYSIGGTYYRVCATKVEPASGMRVVPLSSASELVVGYRSFLSSPYPERLRHFYILGYYK
jgi:hypothetical protein